MDARIDELIAFWIGVGPRKWFGRDDALDASIRERYLTWVEQAAAGQLSHWEPSARGALALLLLLDQFPRNLYRGHAQAFAADAMARGVADRAIARGFDRNVDRELRNFFYLPFMHSEQLHDQQRCVELVRGLDDDDTLAYAIEHRDIIERFGRFPHRNPALGRATTPEERRFLDEGGFSA